MYVVIRSSGEVEAENCTLEEAAAAVLSYDGHRYEVRRTNGFWRLWVSQFSDNSPMGGRPLVKSVIYSIKPRRRAAEADIWQQVADMAAAWHGQEVMTAEEYQRRRAEAQKDEEEGA